MDTWRNLYKTIKHMLWLSSCLRLLTFSFSKHGVKSSKLRACINFSLLLLYIPLTIVMAVIECKSDAFIIYKSTAIIQLFSSLVYVITAWICAILNQQNHLELLQEIIAYDTKSCELGLKINYEKCGRSLRKKALLRCCLSGILLGIIGFNHTRRHFNMELVAYLADLLPLLLQPAIYIQSMTYLDLVKTRLTSLNDLLDNKPINKVQQISNTCSLHHDLTKIIKLINRVFGLTFLASFSVSFVNIVVGFYYCANNFNNPNVRWVSILVNLQISLAYLFDTIHTCYTCHQTIKEVKQTGIIIYNIQTYDCDVKNRIELFSLQIANDEVEFNAAGFFSINLNLLVSIIGGITTYIIILIQLSN